MWLEKIATIGSDAVGLDWMCSTGQARGRVGDQVALQGNMDPMVLFSDPQTIRQEVRKILESYGHGISQFTPPENVAALVDAVHELSKGFH